jgi:OOP family OmpA-OmpF porin
MRTLLLILISFAVNAQVYNGSFEVATCPDFIGNKADGWHNVRCDSDLISSCDSSRSIDYSDVGVPCNWFGCQQPQQGDNYIALCLGAIDNDIREWVKGEIEPMVKDSVYLVQFYYSRSDKYQLAANNIGCYFGDMQPQYSFYTDYSVIDYSKVIAERNMLVDTSTWVLFSQYYIAKGGEQNITLGNFYPDYETKYESYESYESQFNYAYYYIDNVSVTKVMATSVKELPLIKPKPIINFNLLGQQLW